MRRTIPPLVVLLVFVALAAPAGAEEVEGDGFSFRLPAGFEKATLADLPGADAAEAQEALQMLETFTDGSMGADIQVFTRPGADRPEAVLTAMSMHMDGMGLDDEKAETAMRAMEAGLRQQLEQGEVDGATVIDGHVQRTVLPSGDSVLELAVTADNPQRGEVTTSRMIFAWQSDGMVMVVYEGYPRNEATDNVAWRGLVGSLRIDSRSALVRMALKYGPFALGGLVLLIGFSLFRRAGRPGAMPSGRSRSFGGASEGPTLSRPLDGLPVYSESDPAFADSSPQRSPVPDPVEAYALSAQGAPAAAHAGAPAGARPGLKVPTLSRVGASAPAAVGGGTPASLHRPGESGGPRAQQSAPPTLPKVGAPRPPPGPAPAAPDLAPPPLSGAPSGAVPPAEQGARPAPATSLRPPSPAVAAPRTGSHATPLRSPDGHAASPEAALPSVPSPDFPPREDAQLPTNVAWRQAAPPPPPPPPAPPPPAAPTNAPIAGPLSRPTGRLSIPKQPQHEEQEEGLGLDILNGDGV